MTAEELARSLGITKQGSFDDKCVYTITLDDSDEYARMYTLLDKSDLVSLNTDNMLLSDTLNNMRYESDEFDIDLVANLEDNMYKVVIKGIN